LSAATSIQSVALHLSSGRHVVSILMYQLIILEKMQNRNAGIILIW